MSYYALTINGTMITGVHSSTAEYTASTFENSPRFAGDEVRVIAAPADYTMWTDIRCYEEDGTARDPVWCIQQGYLPLPPGKEIIDGVLVDTMVPEAEAPPTLLQRIDGLHAALDSIRESLLGRLQMLESVRAWSDITRGENVEEGMLVVFLLKRYRCIKAHAKTLLPTPANDKTNWTEDT